MPYWAGRAAWFLLWPRGFLNPLYELEQLVLAAVFVFADLGATLRSYVGLPLLGVGAYASFRSVPATVRLLGALSRPIARWRRCSNRRCQVLSCADCLGEAHTGRCHVAVPEECSTEALHAHVAAAMDRVAIRFCECGRQFTKADGCNKMKCVCGASQCYVCRAPVDAYDHFCSHFRPGGGRCGQCDKCDLYKTDDTPAVKQAAAIAARDYFAKHPTLRGQVRRLDIQGVHIPLPSSFL